jgi:hypothetical protein
LKRVPGRFGRYLAVLAAAVLTTGAIAACGGGDDEVQKLGFKLEEKKGAATLSAPAKAESGLAEITYENKSANPADLQLVRIEGDHDAKEAVEGLEKGVSGKPLPDWFFPAGGIGLTSPESSDSVTQVLQPGTYYAFNVEGKINAKATPVIEVTGDSSDDEPDEGDATVEAGEYDFKSAGPLPSGSREILFENVGEEPHHMIAAKLTDGSDAKDVEGFFKNPKGKTPPIEEGGIQTTAVIEGGESQLVSFELERGKYAFYCFITDREGGKPHALKGMVDEIEVERDGEAP